MKIGIIGAGFTGLSAAYELTKQGHRVTLFEKEKKPGGLAIGFKQPNWHWSLEKHYHHLFTNDYAIINLARQVGQKLTKKRPITSTYYEGVWQLDSPASLLLFKPLPVISRVRTAILLFYLKITPFWKPLERITAKRLVLRIAGKDSWKILWKPLFSGKFGGLCDKVPASWFWARVKKRTSLLIYPHGGFQAFADKILAKARKQGGKIILGKVTEIKDVGGEIIVKANSSYKFDKVIVTTTNFEFAQIAKGLGHKYKNKLLAQRGLGAINVVLELDKKFMDDTYWLNINESYPFLAIVEHTNFMSREAYGGNHLVYVGNYLPYDHKYFGYSKSKLISEFLPYLKKINRKFEMSWVLNSHMFLAPQAQPIVGLNHSKKILPHETPINGVFLANIQQVYPWDRGTNYAVAMGQEVARIL